jgi:uncharacterized repeat protein (TIGR01451 family)
VDAVVGLTTAAGSDQGGYAVASVVADLTKTQSVADGSGGSAPVPGAVITYTLTLSVSGSGSAANTTITDAIPALTTYVPGSLRLDGGTLTDPADADMGRFTGTGIEVVLGALAAPATHDVSFQVRID